MTAWGITSYVAEFFIRGNEPATLGLNTSPKFIVSQSLPALIADRESVVSVRVKQVGNLFRQILIHLDPYRHLLRHRFPSGCDRQSRPARRQSAAPPRCRLGSDAATL